MAGVVCQARRDEHEGGQCPGFPPGHQFLGYSTRHQASQSFGKAEVELLHQLMKAVLSGGDLRVLARREQFPRLLRKVQAMRRRLESA